MTIIMIYCTWEKQKNKYNEDANTNLTETAKINELKDLHNALKEFGLNENDISCNTCKDKGFIKLSDGMNNCPDCYSEPVTK